MEASAVGLASEFVEECDRDSAGVDAGSALSVGLSTWSTGEGDGVDLLNQPATNPEIKQTHATRKKRRVTRIVKYE